jgi:transmembrane sensor
MNEHDSIIDEAVGWHLASDLPEMDWDAFSLWLEADPRHRAAFDEIALADAALAEHCAALRPAFAANDDTPPQRRWGRLAWPGSAIAASLVAVLAFQQFGPGAQTYQTGSQARTVALEDGSSIELAPNSRLEVDGEQIALSGGAWFDIRHDPSRQLSISADGVQITDIGTKFDVQAAAGQVRVEVAEGRVRVSSEAMAHPVDLAQGRALAFDPKGGTATVTGLATSDIGEWRTGRLSFEAAPLTLVAADLARYAGVKVTVADKLGDRHFTGTLVIRDREAALRDLSQLMDLELGRSGDGYRLEPRAR